MNYEKQEFKNGQLLTAECLNRMEEGIKAACDSAPPTCDKNDCSKILSHGKNGHEWIDYPVLTGEDAAAGDKAWSSKITVDRLCPAFSKSGSVVQCEPVRGYPLEVTAAGGGGITATVCGKNLYNAEKYPLTGEGYVRHVSGALMEDQDSSYRFTPQFIPVAHLRGKVISIRNAPAVTNNTSTGAGIAFYDVNDKYISGTNKAQATVPENACFMRFSLNKDYIYEAQIELGETATDHEPYCGNSANGDGGKAVVTSVRGINTVFAYSGGNAVEIAVSGRADPMSVINALISRVSALEKAAIGNT